ncbi:hypothetical protein B0T14DRAFT_607725 [Immersiella caudata]|uniref:CENP-V/GFA domain-containing protein n=1 Tax=Immersiella caudata TaxID=314043 RepID=A0AA39U4L2_9PEZI|nr:hypothetical protein B0T14DRAFT_607725 [Immersiella caudata]
MTTVRCITPQLSTPQYRPHLTLTAKQPSNPPYHQPSKLKHTMSTSTANPQRRPYTGSCHCGFVRYIVYLTLPHDPPSPRNRRDANGQIRQMIYRCNCTTCQKTGLLHVRLPSPPDDFLLLSPLDPLRELGDYQCFDKLIHFLFCRACGVRCFSFMGEWELNEKEVKDPVSGEVGVRKVWSPKKGWVEDMTRYMSVNAQTLDAGQQGLDLREWTEKKWVMYLDCLEEKEDDGASSFDTATYDRPFAGGMLVPRVVDVTQCGAMVGDLGIW